MEKKTINIQKAIVELKRRGVNFAYYNTGINLIEINLKVDLITGNIKQHNKEIGNLDQIPKNISIKILKKLPAIINLIPTEHFKNIPVTILFSNKLINILFDGAILKDDSIDQSKVLEITL